MRKQMPWFRFYVEAIYDRKLRRLPPAQRWLWVTVLTVARQSPEPGRLLLSDGVPVTEDDLADLAAVPTEDVHAGLQAFLAQRMIQQDGDGILRVVNWEKRQYRSDCSTDRVRQHRDRQRGQQDSAASETPEKRFTAVSETAPDNRVQSTENRKESVLTDTCPLSPPDGGSGGSGEPHCEVSPNGKPGIPAQEIIAAWNQECGDVLPQVRVLSEKRRNKLRVRCRELARVFGDEVYSPDWWRGLFRRVRDSPFLRGENRSGWRASLDWLIERRDAVAKVLEGQYQGPGPPKTEFERVRELFQPMERVEDSGW